MSDDLDFWIRKSPFFEASRRHDCRRYTVSNHMYQPSHYDDPISEYWKLVNDVTLWDVGTERQVEITGPDAFAFTNMLTPRDLSRCPVGRCRYVVITDEAGGIINDPVLLRLGENQFWLSTSDSDVSLWAKGVAVHAGMDVQICEPDVAPIQVQGPKSKGVIEALFGADVAGLRFYELIETGLDGIPLIVSRTGWSGEFGYEIFLRDGRHGERLWDAVLEAGAPFGIAATGPSDIARIEAGILGYRADMTIENNPFEVGLERLIDLDKEADYIGKAVLSRIARDGVKRRLVGIEIEGRALPAPFEYRWPVTADDGPIGEVTAAVHSPRLGRNIGYAMVAVEYSALGTAFTVEAPWGEAAAVVVEKPFIDARKTAS